MMIEVLKALVENKLTESSRDFILENIKHHALKKCNQLSDIDAEDGTYTEFIKNYIILCLEREFAGFINLGKLGYYSLFIQLHPILETHLSVEDFIKIEEFIEFIMTQQLPAKNGLEVLEALYNFVNRVKLNEEI